jgi:hypothetical protein
VAVTYQPFATAVQSVYSSDPAAFEWNVYTEGWGRGAAQRYDDSTINAMNAPWMGNMPGWREQGFWQYEDPEMDSLGQKLFRGEFTSVDERNELYLAGERRQHLPGHERARRRDTGRLGRSTVAVDPPVGPCAGLRRGQGRPPVGLDRAHHVEPHRRLR